MKFSCYLVIGAARNRYTSDSTRDDYLTAVGLKVTQKKPTTRGAEIAVKINLSIPNALFAKPTLEANIEVPTPDAFGPIIPADVQDNLANVLSEQLGYNVSLRVVDSEQQ